MIHLVGTEHDRTHHYLSPLQNFNPPYRVPGCAVVSGDAPTVRAATFAEDDEIARREQGIREQEKEIVETRRTLEDRIANQVAAQLTTERARIIVEESKKARLLNSTELDNKSREIADLQEILRSRDEKLAAAQKIQAELTRKQRELDDAKRELELTVEQRVHEALNEVRVRAKQEAEDALKLKVMEKDQTIASMQQKIEELMRRAEQGSQQLQGEVQELALEHLLRSRFPIDEIQPVPKGEFGGDVLHRVIGSGGHTGGTILWETKRTRNWSDAWLIKLREDQRAAKAEIAVIVTQTLPKGVETFEMLDGVWVTHANAALPVALILRHSLLELALARQSSEGLQTKTEMVYQYLTGPRFRQRVEAIVEAFTTMQDDLDKERRVIMKQWAKREEANHARYERDRRDVWGPARNRGQILAGDRRAGIEKPGLNRK